MLCLCLCAATDQRQGTQLRGITSRLAMKQLGLAVGCRLALALSGPFWPFLALLGQRGGHSPLTLTCGREALLFGGRPASAATALGASSQGLAALASPARAVTKIVSGSIIVGCTKATSCRRSRLGYIALVITFLLVPHLHYSQTRNPSRKPQERCQI